MRSIGVGQRGGELPRPTTKQRSLTMLLMGRRAVLLLTVIVAALVLLGTGIAWAASESPPTFLAKWGSYGSGDSQFNYPEGVDTDSSGNVYVADSLNNRVQKFDKNGTFLTKWDVTSGPTGIATDSSDNVYVATYGTNKIRKFSTSGTFLSEWGSSGSGNGQFSGPIGVATDSSNNVYVVDSGNERVQKFDQNGTFLAKWGSYGSGDSQFDVPQYVATDSSDNVYVTERYNNRVQKFDKNGTFKAKWGSYGSGDGQFDFPHGVATDSSGNVYVADDNDRVQKFNQDGTFLTRWGSSGSGDGQFRRPVGVATDSSGNVYVGDSHNHRVQKFDASPDTTPPTVSLTAPQDGSTVSGSVNLSAEATDNKGVTRVDFYVNDQSVGSDTTAGGTSGTEYGLPWDSTKVADGPAKIEARAYDAASHDTISSSRNVTIDNTGDPPPPPDDTVKQWDDSSNFDKLDYGMYWFKCGDCRSDGNADGVKATPSTPTEYYDPNKPTVIYIHGYQPSGRGSTMRESPLYSDLYSDDLNDRQDISKEWKDKGYNVGYLYWNQFADETELIPYTAEQKVWTSEGMQWRLARYDHDKGEWVYEFKKDGFPANSSVTDLLFEEYKKALQNHGKKGEIRVVGHSLGNQVAVRLSAMINQQVKAKKLGTHLKPDRVALLDPYYTIGLGCERWYLWEAGYEKTCTADVTAYWVGELQKNKVVFENYQTTNLTPTQSQIADKMAYARIHPNYVDNMYNGLWDDFNRQVAAHQRAVYWYFKSLTYAPPAWDWNLFKGWKNVGVAPSAMMSTKKLGKLNRCTKNCYWWEQQDTEPDPGKFTETVTDDNFRRRAR